MFGLLNSVAGIVIDIAKSVTAPIEVAVDLAGAVVKPIAEVVSGLASDIKSIKD